MKVSELLRYCELHEWRGLRSKATLRTNIKHLKALIGDEVIADLHYTRLKKLASDLESLHNLRHSGNSVSCLKFN